MKKSKVTIFFLPLKDRPKHFRPLKDFKGEFWHTGIITKEGEIYECFDSGMWSISGLAKLRKDEFANMVCVEAEIDDKKLKKELKSGTDCAEYVARCTGLSNLKGSTKGDLWPEDVYELLKNNGGRKLTRDKVL